MYQLVTLNEVPWRNKYSTTDDCCTSPEPLRGKWVLGLLVQSLYFVR